MNSRQLAFFRGSAASRAMGILLFALCAGAFAASVGDTYQQVVAEKGNPKSQIEAGALRVLNYDDMTIKLRDNVVVSIKALASAQPRDSGPPTPTPVMSAEQQIAVLKKIENDAISKVENLVNQPPPQVPRAPDLRITNWGPIWFHPGAGKPDFDNVDIRTTQELPYLKYDYVTSDFTPDIAFVGNELEFNSATKFFYTDRTIPKKRLTEPEMIQINNLYRVIGRCERELLRLEGPASQLQFAPGTQH